MNLADTLPYSIEGFDTRPGQGPGQYGIAVNLAKRAVEAILKQKLSVTVPLYRMVEDAVKDSVPAYDRGFIRVQYWEDTWLLSGIHVGSNCACFGIEGIDRSALERGSIHKYLRYRCHNVDRPEQAAIVLSAWLIWFNTMAAVVEV
jgi:hypothetical protein